jgi:hypothetical protein
VSQQKNKIFLCVFCFALLAPFVSQDIDIFCRKQRQKREVKLQKIKMAKTRLVDTIFKIAGSYL